MIEGGRPLSGTIPIHGAKNAALPILAASMMIEGTVHIGNVPQLLDIKVMLDILKHLGCRAEHRGDLVILDTSKADSYHIPESLMKQMRASVFLMGPLLARYGKVKIYQPGGCAIGERKIDLHLRGLRMLGAKIEQTDTMIVCTTDRLVGAEIYLDSPSVGATENIMMAAATAKGVTTIVNAAREPEIQDLQNFLNACGANISGAGTHTIRIEGVEQLVPCSYRVIPDRIVAGTLMMAAAVTRGSVTLTDVNPDHLTSIIHVLKRAGVQTAIDGDIIKLSHKGRLRGIDRIVTSPYPAFPTDLQSQVMVLLSLADGVSVIKETIFDSRFKHVEELSRMGADIRVDLNSAFIRGVPRLYGTTVEATDLRAGAALVMAGLVAEGTTIIEQIHHIDRGYDRIEQLFQKLGASIQRTSQSPELIRPHLSNSY